MHSKIATSATNSGINYAHLVQITAANKEEWIGKWANWPRSAAKNHDPISLASRAKRYVSFAVESQSRGQRRSIPRDIISEKLLGTRRVTRERVKRSRGKAGRAWNVCGCRNSRPSSERLRWPMHYDVFSSLVEYSIESERHRRRIRHGLWRTGSMQGINGRVVEQTWFERCFSHKLRRDLRRTR